MSCYEREAGDYKLPVGEFNRIKKELCEFWDKNVEKSFNKAMDFYEKNTNKKYRDAIDELHDKFNYEQAEEIERFLTKTQSGKLAKPKKSTLIENKSSAIMKKNGYFEFSYEAMLRLDKEQKMIFWSVDENNKSVESARNHPFAKKFFSLLDTVKWTNKTGGSIRYSNEYMEENGPCAPSECNLYGFALEEQLRSMGFSKKAIKERMKDGKEKRTFSGGFGSFNRGLAPSGRGWSGGRRY